jgi:mono/diheme cytochrome c family protein
MVNKKALWTLIALAAIMALSACGPSQSTPDDTLSPEEAKGKQLFTQYCAACHDTANDLVVVGPSLVGIASHADEREPGKDASTYLVESITNPDAYIVQEFDDLMPKTFAKTLTEEEIDSLVAFLLTLK